MRVPYNGIHAQKPFLDWPNAAVKFPAGTWIKFIDNVQALDEAKRVNPGLKTVLRHFDGGWQVFDFSSHTERRAHARRFLNSFIDGTFLNYAHNVDAIEGLNEIWASSFTAEEKRKRELWTQAICEEWSESRNSDQRLAHIRLVVANIAVGNDITLEAARIAQSHDAIIGYHPYVPFQNPSLSSSVSESKLLEEREMAYTATRAKMRDGSGEPYKFEATPITARSTSLKNTEDLAQTSPPAGVKPDEWRWYSGRWTEMDAVFKANGVTVDWLFTEAGPIGYSNGHLLPGDGWRHNGVCGGDINTVLSILEYWTDRSSAWNANNNDRALGSVLFNSGGAENEWKHFEYFTPDLEIVADFMANYTPPEVDVPDERSYARTMHLMPQNFTLEQKSKILQVAHPNKQSITQSVDDTFIRASELTSRNAIVWNVQDIAGGSTVEIAKNRLENWVNEHYPPVPNIEYRDVNDLDFF